MSTIIHLVRHGRIPNYEADQSLTPAGRAEALAVGRGLAASIRPGETIRFHSSPARRARETAASLCEGLRQALAEVKVAAAVSLPVQVDDRLQNNQFYLNGSSYDPMLPLIDVARWRWQEQPSPEIQAFLDLQIGFWSASDPVAYWLNNPHPLAESPQAVAERVQACLIERMRETNADNCLYREICVSHSANLRAFLRHVFGRDLGTPGFSEMLTISQGQVEYQGQVEKFQ